MKMHSEKERYIDDVLGSLDGMQRAGAPGFLYTRITARTSEYAGLPALVRRPVISFAMLVLLAVINLVAFTRYFTGREHTQVSSGLEQFAREYALGGSTVYSLNPDHHE